MNDIIIFNGEKFKKIKSMNDCKGCTFFDGKHFKEVCPAMQKDEYNCRNIIYIEYKEILRNK